MATGILRIELCLKVRWSGIVISGASAMLSLDFGEVNREDDPEFVRVVGGWTLACASGYEI